jgi:deoxyribodipyrimidine photo-lyase
MYYHSMLNNRQKINLIWLRTDLRIEDNPALYHGLQSNLPTFVIYILDPYFVNNPVHARRVKFLVKLLSQLQKQITVNIVLGSYTDIFDLLIQKYELNLFANFDIEPFGVKRDKEILKQVKNSGGSVNYYYERTSTPLDQKTGAGNLYSVFTPYKNSVLETFLNAKTTATPNNLKKLQNLDYLVTTDPQNIKIPSLAIETLGRTWDLSSLDQMLDYKRYTNTKEAIETFQKFIKTKYDTYKEDRNMLNIDGISHMSIALKWGLVTPRMLRDELVNAGKTDLHSSHYISELIWREFYKYLLFNNPKLLDLEFQAKYHNKEGQWATRQEQIDVFSKVIIGQTGYKMVDASFWQLCKEGFVHNRTRMVFASILTKNLGLDWRVGQELYRALLLDLDEASNNGGWQWGASVGADPKPIRIFNEALQTKNYDPENVYIKKFLPKNYNFLPIIEHSVARSKALKRYVYSD